MSGSNDKFKWMSCSSVIHVQRSESCRVVSCSVVVQRFTTYTKVIKLSCRDRETVRQTERNRESQSDLCFCISCSVIHLQRLESCRVVG